jgi:hypothetical protein
MPLYVDAMSTRVELSIAGRGEADAPLLSDLIEQVQDFFAMLNGVAETISGDTVERFDWRVIGLSKNSPARLVVEAVARQGHADGPEIAARARDLTADGLQQLVGEGTRPVQWNDNVIEASERFLTRITRGLASTTVGGDGDAAPQVTIGTAAAIRGLQHLAVVREAEPVHPYRELGSFEGYIQNVGTDGWQRPFIIIKSRLSGADVKCFLSGAALRKLEDEPVAKVVWRNRRVTAIGVLKYRSVGRLSQAEVTQLDFADPAEALPQLRDIIDPEFTQGLSSEEYLERVRNGET